MKDTVIRILTEQGVEAASLHLGGIFDRLESVQTYHAVAKHAYWQMKDLDIAVQLLQDGISAGRMFTHDVQDQAELQYQILSEVKGMNYDLASFTWPGWDEAGITISLEQCQLGLQAAQENLRMANELNKGALPISRAHWMLGAQLLAAAEYDQAGNNFAQAAEFGRQAEAHSDVLLALGFEQLAHLLDDPSQTDAQHALSEIKTQLQAQEHGDLFIKQLQDAQHIFG